MTLDLFESHPPDVPAVQTLAPGAVLLRGFARGQDTAMLAEFETITGQSCLRHLVTPGGQRMSVAMSNCGEMGWVSSPAGYSYTAIDPESGQPWPAMPASWRELAIAAAAQAGYADFKPDACLVNQYVPGAKMGLHQDRDEHDFSQPIVSVSLGLPAVFLLGGLTRGGRPQRIALNHGDVVVWGGPARLAFHGVAPLADGMHSVWGPRRVNLTVRCAG